MTSPREKNRAATRKAIESLKNVDRSADEYSPRVGGSYLVGVYLAANAISDVRLVIEGPDCAYMKTQYVQGNHDILSTLTSVSDFHRVVNTALHPSVMTQSREEPLQATVEFVAKCASTAGVLISSMPMAFVTGADYERLCRNVETSTGKDVVHVRGLSLMGDWLDGYEETQRSLAKQLPLPERTQPKDPKKVAVVGLLWDRNEYDNVANLTQIKEMVAAAGLDLTSVWLSGGSWEQLKQVSEAGTILSLPYGRQAAKLLAKRIGATLLELPLPFGLTACEEWMQTLGNHFGTQTQCQAYVDRKLGSIVPRIEWAVPFQFQGIKAGFIGDPHLLPGFADIVTTLGGSMGFALLTNRPIHAQGCTELLKGFKHLIHPRQSSYSRDGMLMAMESEVDLVVANSDGLMVGNDCAIVEFGFPSMFSHALYERPFLGFGGFMAFVDTLNNALRRQEVERMKKVREERRLRDSILEEIELAKKPQ